MFIDFFGFEKFDFVFVGENGFGHEEAPFFGAAVEIPGSYFLVEVVLHFADDFELIFVEVHELMVVGIVTIVEGNE